MTVAVLGLSIWVCLTSTPKLGLDLSGGTSMVLKTHDSETVKVTPQITDQTIEVMRGRVDAFGMSEVAFSRSGKDGINVELAGVQDPREAAALIGKTAQLQVRPVLDAADPAGNGADGKPLVAKDKQLVVEDADKGPKLLLGPVALAGNEIKKAEAGQEQQSTDWVVNITFSGKGSDNWRTLTGAAACAPPGSTQGRIAILLDGRVLTAPNVVDTTCKVGQTQGRTMITGNFTNESAQELATLINGGALPVPVTTEAMRTVGPTLGKDAIEQSGKAGVAGLILTILFIIFAYRLVGALAALALVCYAAISYAVLVIFGATLTLPGLAGFVLAIGMAIDTNVLVFERAREEDDGSETKKVAPALEVGYSKAWSAIWDSNATTMIAAGLLFWLAQGPVRGFGVTLVIGVLASMLSGLVVARVFTEHALKFGWVRRHPPVTGLVGTGRVRAWLMRKRPEIMGRHVMFICISIAALALAALGIVTQGLNLGVEFTGGRQVEYSTTQQAPPASEASKAVEAAGVQDAAVTVGDDGVISVRASEMSTDDVVKVGDELGKISEGKVTKSSDELIGPSLGDQLRKNALVALGLAFLAQMIYLAFRFRWNFGVSAVLAMFHDVVLVVGLFAWTHLPVDSVFLAAALTIVGLSVNDTVVVFDRVRERLHDLPRHPTRQSFSEAVNLAALETMPRTVNTGMGTFFILFALLFFGGDSLFQFAAALVFGLAVGTYSSVFLASPLLVASTRFVGTAPKEGNKKPEKKKVNRNDYGAVV